MTYKIPCEQIVWTLLPAIRKEMAISLIKQHKMTQKEAAKKIGVSEAAVSRYISGKRGGLDISTDTIQKEIDKSTKQIIKGDEKTVITETCQVCKLLQKNNILEKLANGP